MGYGYPTWALRARMDDFTSELREIRKELEELNKKVDKLLERCNCK